MNKTIWIISEVYYPEEISTGYILTKIAEDLAKDYIVRVITGTPDHIKFQGHVQRLEKYNGVFIERCNAPRLNKNNIITRIIRAFFLSFLMSLKTYSKVCRGDLILIVTNPPLLMFFAPIISFLKKVKFCLLVHDVFPENLVAAKLIKSNSFILHVLKSVSIWVYQRSYKIIVVGRDMKQLIETKINAATNASRLQVITNWADCDTVQPSRREDNLLISELSLQDKFIVQFAGNLGRVQGLEYVIETAKLLRTEDIHFLFIGDGAMRQAISENIRRHKLTNITLIGSQPRNLQTDFLNACDVALISLAPGMLGMGVPSKAYNIMAAGKPIIAVVEPHSEIGLVVEEEVIGWVVKPGDAVQLSKIILKAKAEPSLLKEMGVKARYLAESRYSFSRIMADYKVLIQDAFDQYSPTV